jgi:3-oxoacyl-[acyl-carrier protein] reductase
MSMQRRKALITGAGRNIGRAIALRLARSGCDVVIHTRTDKVQAEAVAEAARAHGVEALVCLGDIGSRDDMRRMTECVLAGFGHVDILANVAAIRPDNDFLQMSFEEWQRVIDANLGSVFHLTQACLPGMVERRWGRIINLTGMNSVRGYAKRTHIAASKHAVWGLTKALSREFGRTILLSTPFRRARRRLTMSRRLPSVFESRCRRSRLTAWARQRKSPRWSDF